jgi:hypothetical protein
MRLRSSSVTPAAGGAYDVTLVVENDNNNGGLATSWRRWWHCQIQNLNPAGQRLQVTVDSTGGYSDTILPAWSLSTDGVNFAAYQRCPTSAVPANLGSGRHRFVLDTPAGTVAIRLAKYLPYTVARKDAWVASVQGDPRVQVSVIGTSVQGRPIHRLRLTDTTAPSAGKQGIWIHSGIHPAETTSYFTVEGLVNWLLSPDPEASVLLAGAIIDIVPMANPDGVFLGNYRTNANSVNLENEWAAPYNSSQPEIVALRTQIEQAMGSVASPGANPLRVVLNLHSSHNVAFPFHFQHSANSSWTPGATGVLPVVNQDEGNWINRFRANSAFVNAGSTLSSSAGYPSRPFVESMMHDRWTAQPGWLSPSGSQEPVMAITFEGTYGLGPDGVNWNTEADYRSVGEAMGRTLYDHLGLTMTTSVTSYGSPCTTATLTAQLVAQPGGQLATFTLVGAPANSLGWFVLGFQQLQLPLPSPWQACNQLASVDAVVGFPVNFLGIATLSLQFPAWPGLQCHFQTITTNPAAGPGLILDSSSGVTIRNNF